MDKRTLLLVLLFLLMFAGCGVLGARTSVPRPMLPEARGAATPAPVLTGLHGPDELKAQFNKDSSLPRIILLVSPT